MSIFTNTYPIPAAEVLDTREITLAAVDPATGVRDEIWRFRLDPQVGIQPVLTGLFPPAISIGDAGRDNQPFASTDSHDDFTAGVGVHVSTTEASRGRYWWGTLDTRRKREMMLLPRKTNRGNPRGGATPVPITTGCGFGNYVVVCVGTHVYAYDSTSEAWTTATGTPTVEGTPATTLAANATSDPVEWDGNLYIFTGNAVKRWTGAAWSTIANDALAGTVWGGQMWTVDALGNIEKSAVADLSAPTVVSTVKFTDDDVTGMTVYMNAEGAVVPYIIGKRRLYSIDPTTNVVYPTGPKLPPHQFPLTAAEFGGDRNMYIAQGMSVLQWGGDLAQDIGLTQDDGVPPFVSGSIKKITCTERDIFILISKPAATAVVDITEAGMLADPFVDFVAATPPPSYSVVMIRSGSGWHPLVVADSDAQEATAMWVSYTPNKYRLWVSWGTTLYTVELEYGFPSPLDMVPREYEPFGYIITPWQDFTYKEEEKLVLLVSVRARFPAENMTNADPCVIKPYIGWDDNDMQWEELRPGDGSTFGIHADGRTDILIHADRFPPFNDNPAAGRVVSNVRLMFELRRGSQIDCTPRLIAYTMHCLKVTPALMGWAAVIDMTDEWRGKSPDQQWFGFLRLLDANERGLLHYSYTDTEQGELGQMWPVKITGVTGVQNTGPLSAGKLRVSFSEVIHATRQ